MRKIVLAALLWALSAAAAAAQTCGALPFTFTANTTIHASQVNSDLTALLNCINTQVAPLASPTFTGTVTIPTLSLTSPLPAGSGGSTVFIGGTSTGSANAQVVATLTPSGFTLTAGNHVIWKAGFTNTGALTLNANATGTTNVFKMGAAGATALVGQEIQLSATYEGIYDGAEFVLVNPTTDPTVAIPSGVCVDYAGTSAPAGWVFGNSQVLSAGGANTNLIALMGTTFGSSGTTPDMRGRATFGVDNMGGIGAANRLGSNSSAGGFSGTVSLGSASGAQTHTPILAETFAHTHSVSAIPGPTLHSGGSNTTGDFLIGTNQSQLNATTCNSSACGTDGTAYTFPSSGNGTSGTAGSSTAFNITPPALAMNKICKL